MELICIEDYSDTRYTLKVGDSTEHLFGITEAYKARMVADFPSKFTIVDDAKERPDFEIETRIPEIKVSKVKLTKKA